MTKLKKRIIAFIAGLLVLLFIAGLLAGNYFYNIALNPSADRSVIFGSAANPIEEDKNQLALEAWYDSTNKEDAHRESFDGLRLHSVILPHAAPTARWAIVCHGYTGNSRQMISFAQHFLDLGYNVLMPDARGHGESEGDYIGMGWDDRRDIVGWIYTILERDPNAEIVLYGISMGGATVMMTSGEPLPANVKAIVEDCGYSSVKDEFTYQLDVAFGLPAFPVLNFASLVTKARAGFWLGDGSTVKQLAKSATPTLFIHGSADTFVPFSMLNTVYNACAAEKEMYVVEGAKHGEAAAIAGEAYWERIAEFLSHYVSP